MGFGRNLKHEKPSGFVCATLIRAWEGLRNRFVSMAKEGGKPPGLFNIVVEVLGEHSGIRCSSKWPSFLFYEIRN